MTDKSHLSSENAGRVNETEPVSLRKLVRLTAITVIFFSVVIACTTFALFCFSDVLGNKDTECSLDMALGAAKDGAILGLCLGLMSSISIIVGSNNVLSAKIRKYTTTLIWIILFAMIPTVYFASRGVLTVVRLPLTVILTFFILAVLIKMKVDEYRGIHSGNSATQEH